jgi:histidinol-phosphate/aromatic aminotransferase/cobyric acid decarboxylase-like protein
MVSHLITSLTEKSLNTGTLDGEYPAAKAAEFLPKCSEFFERTRQTVSEENWFIKQRIGSIEWLKSYNSSVNFILLKI